MGRVVILSTVFVAQMFLSSFTPAWSQTQQVTAIVRYHQVNERVYPTVAHTVADVQLEAVFSRGGKIEMSEHRTDERSGLTRDRNKQLRLGPNSTRERWRVVASDKIMNVVDSISYSTAILITLSGDSCTAQVAYKLKPGFNDYRYHRLVNGEFAISTSIGAEGVSCTIRGN